jgi:SAM-dependent methyltransferase
MAAEYAETYGDMLAKMPLERKLLEAFVSQETSAPVVDVGCGPGQVVAYLRERGVPSVGLDISWEMVRRARVHGPCAIADIRWLPFADACLGGVAALFSVIFQPRTSTPSMLAEFGRCCLPTAPVLVLFLVGQGEEHSVGRSMSYFEVPEMAACAREAGLAVEVSGQRGPYNFELHKGSHGYLLARA